MTRALAHLPNGIVVVLALAALVASASAEQAAPLAKTKHHRGLSCLVVIEWPRAFTTGGTYLGRDPMWHPCSDTDLSMAWRGA